MLGVVPFELCEIAETCKFSGSVLELPCPALVVLRVLHVSHVSNVLGRFMGSTQAYNKPMTCLTHLAFPVLGFLFLIVKDTFDTLNMSLAPGTNMLMVLRSVQCVMSSSLDAMQQQECGTRVMLNVSNASSVLG